MEGLKLNGTHQLLIYAHQVNLLDENIHTIKKNTEASVVTSQEISLGVHAEETMDV
jgi:hypothetical protein